MACNFLFLLPIRFISDHLTTKARVACGHRPIFSAPRLQSGKIGVENMGLCARDLGLCVSSPYLTICRINLTLIQARRTASFTATTKSISKLVKLPSLVAKCFKKEFITASQSLLFCSQYIHVYKIRKTSRSYI